MLRHPLIDSSPRPISEDVEQRIYEALYANNKILAIKEHRSGTGAGLAESKEFIDVLDRQLRTETPERFAPRKKLGCAGMVMLAMGAAAIFAFAI